MCTYLYILLSSVTKVNKRSKVAAVAPLENTITRDTVVLLSWKGSVAAL